MSEFCPACGGRGESVLVGDDEPSPCAYCGTSGRVSEEKRKQWEELA